MSAGDYGPPGATVEPAPLEAEGLRRAAHRAVRQAMAARNRGEARLARLFFDLAARATDEYLAARRAKLS